MALSTKASQTYKATNSDKFVRILTKASQTLSNMSEFVKILTNLSKAIQNLSDPVKESLECHKLHVRDCQT
jgi:hypothetical protein